MKSKLLLIASAAAFFAAGYVVNAQSLFAGPATNQVTLAWTAPTNSPVPYVYEVQQSADVAVPIIVWTVIAQNIPSTQTTLSLNIDRTTKYWRVRSVNQTNASWSSDFSNVASTLWPGQGGNLSVRLGP